MKKILLTTLLAVLAMTAGAQISLGGVVGVNTTGGSNHYNHVAPTATSSYDYTVGGDRSLMKTTTITLMPQIEYTLNDKFDVGADIGAEWSKTTDRSGYTTLRQQVEGFDGWRSTAAWSFLFAPYVHYNMIHSGRWTIFGEAQLTFSLTPNATRHIYTSAYSLYGVDHPEVDADDMSYSLHESSIGITVVPGVDYSVNEWLSIDLYIDLMGVGFIHSRTTEFNDYTTAGGATNTNEVTKTENLFFLTANLSSQDLTTALNLFRLSFSIHL